MEVANLFEAAAASFDSESIAGGCVIVILTLSCVSALNERCGRC